MAIPQCDREGVTRTPPPPMVEVRSSDGKLLCRLTSDGRTLEIVRRGVRYHVAIAAVGDGAVLFVSEVIEEKEKENVKIHN